MAATATQTETEPNNDLVNGEEEEEEEVDDPNSPWPRHKESNEYLAEHRILELFNNMTSQLIFHRPENPKMFMIEVLEKLHKSRSTHLDFPCLFDESNIQSVFGMLDPTGRGYITLTQYLEAMMTLGVENFSEKPSGADQDRISYDIFHIEAKRGLARASATFKEL